MKSTALRRAALIVVTKPDASQNPSSVTETQTVRTAAMRPAVVRVLFRLVYYWILAMNVNKCSYARSVKSSAWTIDGLRMEPSILIMAYYYYKMVVKPYATINIFKSSIFLSNDVITLHT